MFFLNLERFTDFNADELNQFVNCWASYYRYSVKKMTLSGKVSDEEIDYFSEINFNNDLTQENVINLLRWKDPKYLSNHILSGPNEGSSNDRVDRVVDKLSELNQFRRSEITSDDFKKITSQFFPNGIIWEIFIFHICKPLSYPIADQHVFRSYHYHNNCQLNDGWEKYEKYRKYFHGMFKMMPETIGDELHRRKKLDNALMAYGQFLKKYGQQ